MRTGELEGMRSVAPACLSACFVVHMCTCCHALRGNVDTAPRRAGVDEPRRQCDQVHRTSCAPASLKYAVSSACLPERMLVVHMCAGVQRLMFGSHRKFSATPWAFRRLVSVREVSI